MATPSDGGIAASRRIKPIPSGTNEKPMCNPVGFVDEAGYYNKLRIIREIFCVTYVFRIASLGRW